MNSTEIFNPLDLIEQIKSVKNRVSFYNDKLQYLANDIKVLSEDIAEFNNRQKMIENAKQYYLQFIDKVYLHSIEEMENFVNYVLSYVFFDEEYKIRFELSDKYNKSITFYLYDGKKGLELPLRKGNGNGVKAVVSFVLLAYYLIRQQCPYMFLDEAFVNISAGYIERFFDFVRTLCHDHNMCIVLITHDPRFVDFADIIYEVKNGNVEKVL